MNDLVGHPQCHFSITCTRTCFNKMLCMPWEDHKVKDHKW